MKFIILYIALLFTNYIYGQEQPEQVDTVIKDSLTKETPPDNFYFDLATYNYLKSKPLDSFSSGYVKYLNDSTRLTFMESKDGYQVEYTKPKSLYSKYYQYYKTTNTLKSSIQTFQRMNIGERRDYDSLGNLIETHNYDSIFKFTLEDLQQVVLKDYGQDIFAYPQSVGVSRNESLLTYDVIWSLDGRSGYGSKSRIIRIDGTTGKIILDIVKENECKTK